MKVKELIIRLLDEPMDAEVCLQDPTEYMSNGAMCRGYLFDTTHIEHWNKYRVCISFKDWRKEADIDCFDTCKHAYSEVCDECYKGNKYDVAERSR